MQNHDSGAKVYSAKSKLHYVFPRADRVFVITLSNSEKTFFQSLGLLNFFTDPDSQDAPPHELIISVINNNNNNNNNNDDDDDYYYYYYLIM